MKQIVAALGMAMLAGIAASSEAGDWPGFRGPHGNGKTDESGLPTEWSKTENIKWRIDLPGPANGSPIVVDGKVFVTSAQDQGRTRTLHCVDRNDGSTLWTQRVEIDEVESTHKTNPYSGTTPASDGKRVVVWHGTPGLFGYDHDGNELWTLNLGPQTHTWGYGSSPVIHDGRVILNFGPGERTFLIAVDLATGTEIWRHNEPGGAADQASRGGWIGSWSTPTIVDVDGKTQVLCPFPSRVVACDFETGDLLWSVAGLENLPKGNLAYASLVVSDDLGVAMGGYQGPAIGFRLGGSGDTTETHRLWREVTRNPQRIGSGVIIDGLLYVANAGPSIVQCIDPATGEVLWQDRLPGGNAWGSLVYADGKLYATSQDATITVFRPDPEKFEPIAVNSFKERTNSTPAISDGEIFVRTYEALYCIAEESK